MPDTPIREPVVGDVLEVHWDDAAIWRCVTEDVNALEEETPVISWGRVCRLTDKSVFLEFSTCEQGSDCVVRIPKTWITGIVFLEPPTVARAPKELDQHRPAAPPAYLSLKEFGWRPVEEETT